MQVKRFKNYTTLDPKQLHKSHTKFWKHAQNTDTASQPTWEASWETRPTTRERQNQGGGHSIPAKANALKTALRIPTVEKTTVKNRKPVTASTRLSKSYQHTPYQMPHTSPQSGSGSGSSSSSSSSSSSLVVVVVVVVVVIVVISSN